jgi:hypothetical protein
MTLLKHHVKAEDKDTKLASGASWLEQVWISLGILLFRLDGYPVPERSLARTESVEAGNPEEKPRE